MHKSGNDPIRKGIFMNIYEYLKKDHEAVANLFELYKTAPTEVNKLEIIDLIVQKLNLHANSEEPTFYKLLAAFQRNEGEVLHAEEEHADIKAMITALSKVESIDEAVDLQVMELKNIVDHHVSEEESTLFDSAKNVFTEEEAVIIKEKMHYFKFKLLHKKMIKIKANVPSRAKKEELV